MVGIEMRRTCSERVSRALQETRLLITVTRNTTICLLPTMICSQAQLDKIVARIVRLLS